MKNNQKPKKKFGKIVIALVALVVIGVAISGGNKDKDKVSTDAPVAAETSAEVAEEPALEHFEVELTNGYYTCGIDFPQGKYDITAISGCGNVSSSNMYSGGLNEIMGFDESGVLGDTVIEEFNNAKFKKGDVLSISQVSLKIVSDDADVSNMESRENPLTETVDLANGNFVAGEDFPAGEYDIVAVSGGGNVSSDNMFQGGINAILGTEANDMYEKEYKNVSLDEGVTLKVSGVNIQLVPSK